MKFYLILTNQVRIEQWNFFFDTARSFNQGIQNKPSSQILNKHKFKGTNKKK